MTFRHHAAQDEGKDTSLPSVTRHLGGVKQESSVRELMAISRAESRDVIDRMPGEANVLADSHSSGGAGGHGLFLPASTKALLTRLLTNQP